MSTKFSHFGGGGSCAHLPLPIRAKFGKRHGLCLHAKIHLNPFIVSPSRNEKLQFWANVDIWGPIYLSEAQSQIRYASINSPSTLTCQIDRFILSSLSGGKPQIVPFFGIRHFVVSPVGDALRKLNAAGAQQETIPYPTVSELFLYDNAFKAKSCAQIPSFTSPSFTRVTSQG